MLSDNIKAIREIGIIDPDDKVEKTTNVNQKTVQRLVALHRHNSIFELCFLIAGFKPPINNIGFHEDHVEPKAPLATLLNPTNIFRGLNRPYVQAGADDNVYVYCLKVSETYKYLANMVCVAKLVESPEECVLAVYVERDQNNNLEIIHWEWVEVDETGKPIEWKTRYSECLQ